MEKIPGLMKAVVIEGPKKLAVKEVATPEPLPGEVLIKIETCLLCTWEQRIYSGESSMKRPFIAGHEAAGVIAKINPDTPSNFSIGDKVAFKTLDHCGHCYYCYQGFENQCTGKANKRFYDGIPGSGGLAQYISLPVDRVFPIEWDISLGEAAFTEPLACCIHSVKRSGIKFGSVVVVVGAGIMGQLHAVLARLSGAKVIVIEPNAARRNLALSLGAHAAVDPTVDDEKTVLNSLTRGVGPDVVFITTASTSLAEKYLDAAGKMGRVIFYGSFHPNKDIPIDPNKVHYSEIVITGSASPSTEDFFQASRMLAQKLVPVKEFISCTYSLDNIQEAFEASLSLDTYRVMVELR
ncbi:MAG: alcohol dehydrogenase catalytic domain-containing protein [Bacillota bacterium]